MYVWFSLIKSYSLSRDTTLAVIAVMVGLIAVPACKREERLSDLHPGQGPPAGYDNTSYEENAVALTEANASSPRSTAPAATPMAAAISVPR